MNFFMFGGCEITDTLFWLREQCPQHEFRSIGSTTLGSMFSKHGRIADRVYEWYNDGKDERKQRSSTAQKIYKEIIEKDQISSHTQYGWNKKDSWIILSFAYESQARFIHDDEHISLMSELIMDPGKKYTPILQQLNFPMDVLEIVNDPRYTVAWDHPDVNGLYWKNKGNLLPKLGEMLYEAFEDRVLLIYTPPAKKYHNSKFGVYHQLPTPGQYVPAFWKTTSGTHWEDYSWEHIDKCYTGIYNGFRRWYPSKPRLIKFKWDNLIGDDEHRWGKSPFHYTEQTTNNIGQTIKTFIDGIDKNKFC